MDTAVLGNKEQFPSDEIIFSHIGKTKKIWLDLFEHIHAEYPDIISEWRYYNDGKSWLLKVTRKKKTVFWLSVLKGCFRITFYFTEKADRLIRSAGISDRLKEEYFSRKHKNKIKGLTVVCRSRTDTADVKKILPVKLCFK